jgi:hypothetical protein
VSAATFCGGRTHGEVTGVYRDAKDAHLREHPLPADADDTALWLRGLDAINHGDNAVNELCGDAHRYDTGQHLRYLRGAA